MRLKTADDKSERLALLNRLRTSTDLDTDQRKWADDQWWSLQRGIRGEAEAAFYIDGYFAGGENHVWIHDLRIQYQGEVAQIDHLVINRGLGFYLIETKNYAANIIINEQGEFTADYGKWRTGIESPLEQGKRHERVLNKVLDHLEISGRFGSPLEFYHVVMFHPKVTIQRPPEKSFDTSHVIKADQFPSWRERFVNKQMAGFGLLRGISNVRSLDTVRQWGESLVRLHRPLDVQALPEFMRPRKSVPAASLHLPRDERIAPQALDSPSLSPELKKSLKCVQCGVKLSLSEGRFCWQRPERFKGLQYCREHQAGHL